MKSSPNEPQNFEESMKALEAIVRGLEQGTMPLDKSLEQYAAATKHLQFCYERLRQAEKSILVLRGVEEDGVVDAVPLDENGGTLAEKQATRGKRRSARSDLGG